MNEKVIGLIRTGGVIVLFVIGVLLILNAMGSTATVDEETQMVVEEVDQVTASVSYALYLVYACIGAIIIFTIWSIIQHPKRFISSAISIVIFAIIVGIGYALADSTIIPELLEGGNAEEATEGAHKWGGTGNVKNMMRYFSK